MERLDQLAAEAKQLASNPREATYQGLGENLEAGRATWRFTSPRVYNCCRRVRSCSAPISLQPSSRCDSRGIYCALFTNLAHEMRSMNTMVFGSN